jgi:hypothetical protein
MNADKISQKWTGLTAFKRFAVQGFRFDAPNPVNPVYFCFVGV